MPSINELIDDLLEYRTEYGNIDVAVPGPDHSLRTTISVYVELDDESGEEVVVIE